MTRLLKTVLVIGVAAVAATAASAAYAQASGTASTPQGWSYELKDGKRVPKTNRVTNADGSWTEEVRKGTCVETKEKSPSGEVKITRKCD